MAPARDALVAGDTGRLGALMTENREATSRPGFGVITARIDTLFDAAEKAGATGGKTFGAGGGCTLLPNEEDRRETVAEALQSAGAKLPPFGFASRSPTAE